MGSLQYVGKEHWPGGPALWLRGRSSKRRARCLCERTGGFLPSCPGLVGDGCSPRSFHGALLTEYHLLQRQRVSR